MKYSDVTFIDAMRQIARWTSALVITRVPAVDDVVGASGDGEHRALLRRQSQFPRAKEPL